MTEQVPCPYVYKGGKKCNGHIVRVEAFKADLSWSMTPDGVWSFIFGEPRSHFHLHCSEKGNHAGWGRPDAQELKFYLRDLPDELRKVVSAT